MWNGLTSRKEQREGKLEEEQSINWRSDIVMELLMTNQQTVIKIF